jgi:tRNA uridine 5-carboxymethylaminomethyl modification enzyme
VSRQKSLEELQDFVKNASIGPFQLPAEFLDAKDNIGTRLDAILRKPKVSIIDLLPHVPLLQSFDRSVLRRLEIEIKYEGYIDRERRAIRSSEQLERVKIPSEFAFESVSGLSREVVEKLKKHRPHNLGQASRISGLTPAAIQILHVHITM